MTVPVDQSPRVAPDVSVVVVTHNGRERALETITSAMAASGTASVQWVLVDNASTDGTPDAVAAAFPEMLVLQRPNRGFAAGNNAAFDVATGRYVLLLNPDVVFHQGTIGDLVGLLDARPEVGAAGVLQRDADGEIYPSAWRFPSPSRQWGEALVARRWRVLKHLQEANVVQDDYAVEHDVDWVTGSFLVVRRDVIDAVGPMDERFFLYAEETDWCLRIHQRGWAIRHLPQVEVVHYHEAGIRPDLAAHMAWSKRAYALKHFSQPARTLFLAALAFRYAARTAVFAPLSWRWPERYRIRSQAESVALCTALGLSEPSRPP